MQQALTGTPQACGDGTGRINLEGRSLVFIGTVDRGQSFHHIAAFLLSKGETKEEILRGLRAISKKIDAVHRAMLRLPAGEALYNASELGAGYTWAPKTDDLRFAPRPLELEQLEHPGLPRPESDAELRDVIELFLELLAALVAREKASISSLATLVHEMLYVY